jgi:hypothetical protein
MPRVVGITPNASRTSGGTALTITGYNFHTQNDGSAPSVVIGGIAATSVVVVDQYTITCVSGVAVDPSLCDVAVTVGTQTGTLYGAFTYYEGIVLRVVPSYGVIAGGTDVVIEGYNFLPGSVVLFDGVIATEILFIDSQHIACKTPSHSQGFVDVTIVEPL